MEFRRNCNENSREMLFNMIKVLPQNCSYFAKLRELNVPIVFVSLQIKNSIFEVINLNP